MKILVPLKVPFDPEMANIGIRLAKTTGSELTFLNVVDTRPFKGYIKLQENFVDQLREDGEMMLQSAISLAEKEGIRASKRIVEGHPEEEILKAEKDADILLVRIRRFSSEEKVGNVTKDVLEHTVKPVYVFKGKPGDFKKILVTIDDSECSKEALEFAMAFAKLLGLGGISAHFAARSPERVEAGKKTLEFARKKGAEKGMEVDTHLDEGTPANEIIKLSEGFDLIVVGSVGQGAISKLFLGSTARKVTIFSKRDVIIVPPCN